MVKSGYGSTTPMLGCSAFLYAIRPPSATRRGFFYIYPMKNSANIAYFIAIVSFLFSFGVIIESNQRKNQYQQNYAALTDSVKTWKDKYGRQVAEKNVLVLENQDQLLELKHLRGTNKRIQNTLSELKNTISAISHDVTTLTSIESDQVKIIEYRDSLPVYKSEFKTEWEEGVVIMGHDSLKLEQKILNKFDYAIHRDKNLLKPDTIRVRAISLNPNTYTNDLSSFSYSLKPKRWTLGPSVTYGIGANGAEVIVGGSITYGIIQF